MGRKDVLLSPDGSLNAPPIGITTYLSYDQDPSRYIYHVTRLISTDALNEAFQLFLDLWN
jgi:hypothetical protein